MVLAFALVKAWHRRRPAPQPQQPPETPPVAPTPALDEPSAASDAPAAETSEALPPAPDEPLEAIGEGEAPAAPAVAAFDPGPTLFEKLQEIKQTLVPCGATCAHPRELADQAAFKEAVELLEADDVALDLVVEYALGTDWPLACAGLATLPNAMTATSRSTGSWRNSTTSSPGRCISRSTIFSRSRRAAGRAPLVVPRTGGSMSRSCRSSSAIISVRRATSATPPTSAAGCSQAASPTRHHQGLLERVDHPLATALVAQLDTIGKGNIDHAFLSSIGRFWSDQTRPKALVEPAGWNIPLASAQATLQQSPVRSLLVSGEPLVGKTSFLQLVANRLKSAQWNVFEASGADLMAGQVWFGQLEGRVRQLVDQVTVKKRLIWYVPDLLQLARSGTHQGQSASILDQILPAITAGRLVIWTQASPTGTARLRQSRPALRNIPEVIWRETHSEANTSLLARAVASRLATISTSRSIRTAPPSRSRPRASI